MLKIGTFSKLSRLSIRMLRRYDELGLLQPVHTDPFTGYRYYREEQLTTAGRIAALRDMGFGLSAIGALLEDGGREELDRRLAEQQRALEALLAETRQRLRLLDTARAQLRKDESTMEYSVTLKNLTQRRAACVRMTLPSYEAEHQLWQVMARETAPLSLRLEEPCLCSVTYYDGEYREREVDAEAQKTVRGDYPDTEHVRFRTLPAVTFASATFRGPYDKIRAANAAVAAWVRDQLRKDESTMEYSVTLKNLTQRRAACVRMTLPSYEAEHQLWQVMARETAPLSLRLEEPCLCSVTYYDGEYREREVDAEAQKTVRGDYPDTEHVRFRTLPAVTFASATFRGPYDKIRAANAAVAAWVRDNGYAFDGPAFNIYHVNPSETDDPEEYVTEVCYPVKKRA